MPFANPVRTFRLGQAHHVIGLIVNTTFGEIDFAPPVIGHNHISAALLEHLHGPPGAMQGVGQQEVAPGQALR